MYKYYQNICLICSLITIGITTTAKKAEALDEFTNFSNSNSTLLLPETKSTFQNVTLEVNKDVFDEKLSVKFEYGLQMQQLNKTADIKLAIEVEDSETKINTKLMYQW